MSNFLTWSADPGPIAVQQNFLEGCKPGLEKAPFNMGVWVLWIMFWLKYSGSFGGEWNDNLLFWLEVSSNITLLELYEAKQFETRLEAVAWCMFNSKIIKMNEIVGY